jgi:hypothetical protein
VKFVDEPTAVDARFEVDGAVRPRRFFWGGNWLDVSDVGRQWMGETGLSVLVMVGGQRTFELLLERENLTWRVVRAPDDVSAA